MLKSESTRCYLCQRKQSDQSSKVRSKRKPNAKTLGLRLSKLRPAPGTTSSELLQHLKEDFDVPLHPHFVQRILEMGIKMYRKWNDVHGAVLELSVPGFDDKTSKEVNISEATTDTFSDPRTSFVIADNSCASGDIKLLLGCHEILFLMETGPAKTW